MHLQRLQTGPCRHQGESASSTIYWRNIHPALTSRKTFDLTWVAISMLFYRSSIFAGMCTTLQWRHNGRDIVSNHQPRKCLLNRLIRCRSKKTSKLRVTGLCAGNSPETGEFPAQRASNAEYVSIPWRHPEDLLAVQAVYQVCMQIP